MKKNLLFVAASATLLFAACTSESGGPSSNISYDALKAAEKADVQTPITFGTFTPREAVTRIINNEEDLATHNGFGVFAYYTEGADYSDAAKPNFMFNQQVVGTSGATPTWSYSPIKYWPNNTLRDGTTDYDISDTKDKLSFFAYAPYIFPADIDEFGNVWDKSDPSAPVQKDRGVIKVAPANGTIAGDVKLTYIGGSSEYSDELMFGVTQNNTAWHSVDGGTLNILAGMPFKDLVKPVLNERTITFYFMHALTKIGMTVIAANNKEEGTGGPALWNDAAADPNKTKILIEKIEFNRVMHYGGVLNLNNTTAGQPEWEDLTNYRVNPLTIHPDGVALAPNEHAEIAEDLAWRAEYATDPTEAWTKTGVVPGVEKSVFGQHGTPAINDYLLLIPETALPASDTYITITYHVMTKDANLPNGVSDVKNVIKKKIPASLQLEKAKSYDFRLILGVTSVDLDVEVKPWTIVNEGDIYLPKNKETAAP